MSAPIYKQVNYTVNGLIQDVRLGKIGLPDLQRPFVWTNNKVRNLFDSMYKGYPVGHLLFWENGAAAGQRQIGADSKQLSPDLVIVDGQQRLTSLFAVMTATDVVRSDFSRSRIRIAINPLDQNFAVTSAAIERDHSYVSDISRLWSGETDLFDLRDEYLEKLSSVRDVSKDEAKAIQSALSRLASLSDYPFTAQQLPEDMTEEDVAEVFVRINYEGKKLNQADFVLTVMSVFWDEGRVALEEFSRECRQPAVDGSLSPYNHIVRPHPSQMLRVSVGLAFRRARLRSIYTILRGKDLAAGALSEERREAQFARLQQAQAKVLNVQYWHDFLQCVRKAGYRHPKVINAANTLLFSYILYLIGRTEIKVEEHTLRSAISQWFFMASLTGRYTGAAETAMESDLAMLRDVTTADEFVSKLSQVCAISLTDDFWSVTLPNELATSAANSPSLSALEAALVILNAPVLFSEFSVAEMADPSVQGAKTIERHHLFPKGYLAKIGISERRDVNQIANYAYVEWMDNVKIGSRSPADYAPEMMELASQRLPAEKLQQMQYFHALPDGWEVMGYDDFLRMRRSLLAEIIQEGYSHLSLVSAVDEPTAVNLTEIIAGGEADSIEFKSTLRVNLHTGERDERMEQAVIKTIAGFLNTHGGTLIVGVADDGNPVGIDADRFASEDKMSQHLAHLVNSRIGVKAWASIHANFDDYSGVRVLTVRCEASQSPAYAKEGDSQAFYVRAGTSTVALPLDQIADYIKERFS